MLPRLHAAGKPTKTSVTEFATQAWKKNKNKNCSESQIP